MLQSVGKIWKMYLVQPSIPTDEPGYLLERCGGGKSCLINEETGERDCATQGSGNACLGDVCVRFD
jgi:hypothetical protein